MANKLYELFHPEIKLQNVRLSGNDPCIDCINVHRYHRGTALESEIIDEEKCKCCMEKTRYEIDCMVKLSWYEDNDEKVCNREKKSNYTYDCGVKCPSTLYDGYPVLYPDGWNDKIDII